MSGLVFLTKNDDLHLNIYNKWTDRILSDKFRLIPSNYVLNPKLEEILPSTKKLRKKRILLSDEFIDGFYGPSPAGLPLWIALIALILVALSLIGVIVLVVIFWWIPKRAKNKIPPKNSTANDWFLYAENNLRYSNKKEIQKGYENALKLDPKHGLVLIRYGQYEASLAIQYKSAIIGDPKGLPSNFNSTRAYNHLKKGIKIIGESRSISNPFKQKKIEPIFAITGVLAFDLKHYIEAKKWLELSFLHKEMLNQRKSLEKSIELRLNLVNSYYKNNEIEKGIDQILYCLSIARQNKKRVHESLAWELLGESFYNTQEQKSAEFCYSNAIKLDSRRWISARRLYYILEKEDRFDEAEKYKKLFIHIQKRLKPI